MVTLTIQPPGASPVAHVLKDETITIGRMSGNTIVINDSSVSLVHAKITRKNGEFFVKDLNSTNGTQVNGQPVSEARLRDRDVVRFADISGQFNAEAEDIRSAAPAVSAQVPLPHPSAPSQTISPPASRPAPARKSVRPASVLAVIGGGVAALAVISFAVWNLTHQGNAAGDAVALQPLSTTTPKPAALGKTPAPAAASPNAAASPPFVTASPSTEAADQPAADVPQLIKALQDPDPAERRHAVAELHSLGPSAATATPALHQALSDPDQEVRLWAALALINVKSYDKAIPPILIHVLHDDKPMVRQLACVSLGLLPYEPAEKDAVVPALIAAANTDADEDVRKAASAALGVIDPDGAGKTIIK